VVGLTLEEIVTNFAKFWSSLTNESQLRWLGPEKGVVHMATGAIVNGVWDLWAKHEGKPLWRLLVELTPDQLVSVIDFRWIRDALTPEEALAILRKNESTKQDRINHLLEAGYPAYTTSAGWLGYSDELIRSLCKDALKAGWNIFKVKVGSDLEDDKRRLRIIREQIGPDRKLMVDANQKWDVPQAIEWMQQLVEFKPWFIEEPTSPDDVLGHATIRRALEPHGIKVATGEHCQNRVLFKQFFQARGLDFCQIDACRIGGVNELLAVLLMAAKFGIKVIPHAGGVGLCEYVQHFSFFDYIAVSAEIDDRLIEYVDHLHEHFVVPVVIRGGRYMPPTEAGFSIQMKPQSLAHYSYPDGPVWRAKRAQ
jgi:L-fuconate dehydratase